MGHSTALSSSKNSADALVLGAGWAGVVTALRLVEGKQRVILLEARDRVGGRAFTHTYDAQSKGKGDRIVQNKKPWGPDGEAVKAVDFGCSWIHGYNEGNPVKTICENLGIPVSIPKPTKPSIIGPSGPLSSELTSKIASNLGEAMSSAQSLGRSAAATSSNTSLASHLFASASPLYKDLKEEERPLAEAYARQLHVPLGVALEQVALRWTGFEQNFAGTDAAPQGGFSRVIEALTSQFIDLGGQVVTGKEVKKIQSLAEESTNEGVKVITTSGEEYEAPLAVCTFPLGVLKQQEAQLFEPALSRKKKEVIAGTNVGNLNKIMLVYDTTWWDSDVGTFTVLPSSNGEVDNDLSSLLAKTTLMVGADSANSRLLIMIGGEAGRSIEGFSRPQVVEALHSYLCKRIPGGEGETVQSPSHNFMTRWSSHGFTGGATSTPVVIGEEHSPLDFVELSRPEYKGNLLFAGEHTEINHRGSVAGAVLSAEREASRALARLSARGAASSPFKSENRRSFSTSAKSTLPKSSPASHAAPATEQRSEGSAGATPPTFFSSASREADAQALKDIFDSPQSSSSSPAQIPLLPSASGLFGSPSLPSPDAFVPLAQRTLVRAQLIVSRIVSAPSNGEGEMMKVVKNLDRLSDVLCSVIDLAELVRNAHPDAQWREAANEAYEGLCGFMNVLNTHTGLYDVLRQVLQDTALRSALSPEALSVATFFLRDFEKSGIHLPAEQRERFVSLSDEILVLGRAFTQGDGSTEGLLPGDSTNPVQFKREWFAKMNNGLLASLEESPAIIKTGSSSEITLDPALTTWELHTILRYAPHPDARRVAYFALNTSGKGKVRVLEELLQRRGELATLTGYKSFGEMALGDKMAKESESVDKFLRALENHHRPVAMSKLEELEHLLRNSAGSSARLEPWDRDYYSELYTRALTMSSPGSKTPISPFFSVGTVFSGLSKMLASLYGIRLRPTSMQHNEAWNGDVVKLEVVEEDSDSPGGEAIIGTIYADLFSRAGKPPSAAHYTVRCSRRIDDDDGTGDFMYGRLEDGSQLDAELGQPGGPASPLEVEGRRNPGREGKYQTPIVVLLCDFVRPTSGSGPSLLGWTEVETLFHEMGHAIHSMIGRTEFHNVSGTRCATDFVEFPSILMEHFISSPSVISMIARHHTTGAELPYVHLADHLRQAKALDSLDTHNQILLALLDQRYHSTSALDPTFDSTKELTDLYRKHGLINREIDGSTWQGQFTHLFGYGATYYSYLFDRAIASRVWTKVFKEEPLKRENGERYKHHVLRWGGGRDGWQMLQGLLNVDKLDMEEVGKWGIGNQEK